ncbi:MAG TPA: PilZ domain-containing protein [Rhodocyclaceae bacterium]|nr:PilZ domain-containing protein [Rhodocyclaceae bacterium]
MSQAAQIELIERRRRQRFTAEQEGRPQFRVLVDGECLPVLDLSLECFSMPAATPPATHRGIQFVLQHAERSGEVCGTARIVNYQGAPAGGQAGCAFESIDGDGLARLEQWLAAHVLAAASVPIRAHEAAGIVRGPSLV